MLRLCSFVLLWTVASLSGQPLFSNQTAAAGIATANVFGGEEKRFIIEAHGSGAAFFDYDGDGDLDLYVVNGSTFETYIDQSGPGNELYRNEGDGTFSPIGNAAGVDHAGWGAGCAVGDLDNDGDRDLYVTNYGPNVLYLNEGDGRFFDATARSGTAGDEYSASAAFFDYDNDGDLDLYATNYVVFDAATRPATPDLCSFYGGLLVYCGPKGLVGAADVLYRNEGNGVFADVTSPLGLDPSKHYYGLGVVPFDVDGDRDLDLFIANDETPNALLRNDGGQRFRDVALLSGVAYNGDGDTEAGMGVDAGDFDGDGDDDLYVTNFFSETNTLYRNEGNVRFVDITTTAGLAAPTIDLLGWGTRFIDYDNDGWLDLFVANGHVYPQVDQAATGSTYRQPNQLFRNLGEGRFAPVDAGAALAEPRVSRGAASGDYDDDGDVDLFVVELNDEPTLLRNEGGNQNNWLIVQAVGTRDNRDGVGARIHLKAGGRSQWRTVNGATSYLSHSDIRVHFGLLRQDLVEIVEITWPNGQVDSASRIAANQTLVFTQGQGYRILGP